MQYGIFVTMQQRDLARSSQQIVNDAIEQTRVADEIGMETAWYPEHHFSNYSLCPSPLVMISHAAAVTRRIRLGAGVLLLPLYHPARLLAEIGMVDGLSNGRLELGLGAGYQKFEFDRFNVDLNNNKQMTAEMLAMLETGLVNTHFKFDGDHYRQPPTAISIRVVQKPTPPIWFASSDPAVMKMAAAKNYGLMASGWFGSSKRLRGMRESIDASCVAAGRDTDDIRLGLLRFAFASDSRREVEKYVESGRYQQRLGYALKHRRENLEGGYVVKDLPYDEELPFEKAMRNVPVGDPETCAERIVADIRAFRPTQIIIHTQIGDMEQKVMLKAMETWMSKVVPLVEKELAGDAIQHPPAKQASPAPA